MDNFKEEDVKNLVSLITRKTINDFNDLDKEEEIYNHKQDIINSFSEEEIKENSFLFKEEDLNEEVKNFGLTKGFIYLENNSYQVNTELEKKELKELYKDLKIYEYAHDNNIINEKNLDLEYLKKDSLFNDITKDDFYSVHDINKIKKQAEDELYYPNLKNEMNNEFKNVQNEYSNEDHNYKQYMNEKLDDIYYGVYETDNYYLKKHDLKESEIDSLYDKYDLNTKINNIEQVKLNHNPELDISIRQQIDKNKSEYESFIAKFYDTKNDNDYAIAGSALASKNLYSKFGDHLDENKDMINKDLKDSENIKRFKSKDDEKIKRLKQDELYRKLVKQMTKNEKFLNSTQSNIAYKSRANADNLSLASSQLSGRDKMNTQHQINNTEKNVRSSIQDTRTDNKIHRNKENKKDNDLER